MRSGWTKPSPEKAPTVELKSLATKSTASEMLGADFFILGAKFVVEYNADVEFADPVLMKFHLLITN